MYQVAFASNLVCRTMLLQHNPIPILINPRRACAARVTVLSLGLCVCVCYSTSHFSRDYSYHKQY